MDDTISNIPVYLPLRHVCALYNVQAARAEAYAAATKAAETQQAALIKQMQALQVGPMHALGPSEGLKPPLALLALRFCVKARLTRVLACFPTL